MSVICCEFCDTWEFVLIELFDVVGVPCPEGRLFLKFPSLFAIWFAGYGFWGDWLWFWTCVWFIIAFCCCCCCWPILPIIFGCWIPPYFTELTIFGVYLVVDKEASSSENLASFKLEIDFIFSFWINPSLDIFIWKSYIHPILF